jgi:hypothetical protein
MTAVDVNPQKRNAQSQLLILDSQEVMNSARGAGFEAICYQHSHVVGEGRR